MVAMFGHTTKDRIRNEVIHDMVGVVLVQHRLRWFGHIPWRPPEAPVNSGILESMKILGGGEGDKVDMDGDGKKGLE
jgi:hypothetical protein